MAGLPLRIISIGAILGDLESAESLTLPDVYSSGGSRNTYIDKIARASSVLGYTKQNPTAVTTDTGGSACILRGLYHYRRQVGGVVRQEIGVWDDGVDEYEIHYSPNAGGTWVFLQDLTGSAVGQTPDFAQIGDDLTICIPGLAPRSYDGTTLQTAGATRLAAPTITNPGTGGQLKGTYQFRVQPVRSDKSTGPASVASAVYSVANGQATVGWVADTDGTTVGYNIYRTTGTGKVYFFEGYADGRTTVTFASTLADLTLIQNPVLINHGDAPPTGARFCEAHKQRMMYGGTDAYPRRWWYSDPGLPYSVHVENAYLDMTDAESIGDKTTGGTGNYKGMFIAWLERSVWTVSGTSEVSGNVIDLNRRRTNAQTGTVSHRTVALIPKGSVYLNQEGTPVEIPEAMLAFLTPLKDLRLFDGNDDRIISWAKQSTFARMNYQFGHRAFVIQDTPRNEFTWVFPSGYAGEGNLAVSWNTRTGQMTERNWPFSCGVEIETSDTASILLAGESDITKGGYCYQLWNGFTFDGTAINARLMTKTFYGRGRNNESLVHYDKRWRWVELLIWSSGAVTLLVEAFPSEAEDSETVPFMSKSVAAYTTEALETADGSPLETSDGSALVANVPTRVVRVKVRTAAGRYLHSRGLRLRVSSSTTTVQWGVVGMAIAYQILPGLKRTFRR